MWWYLNNLLSGNVIRKLSCLLCRLLSFVTNNCSQFKRRPPVKNQELTYVHKEWNRHRPQGRSTPLSRCQPPLSPVFHLNISRWEYLGRPEDGSWPTKRQKDVLEFTQHHGSVLLFVIQFQTLHEVLKTALVFGSLDLPVKGEKLESSTK